MGIFNGFIFTIVLAFNLFFCLNRSEKENAELEQKRQWVENEIEKIVAKQKDIALLEKELRGRDSSLRKKEALLLEKGHLEKKKSKTSLNISKVNTDLCKNVC